MITGNEMSMPMIGNVAHRSDWVTEGGLTIRQHFAAMAMQGMLSNPMVDKLVHKEKGNLYQVIVAHADALINELNKTK